MNFNLLNDVAYPLSPLEKEKLNSRLLDLQIDDTDIILTGYPKSGTYWAKEMIWLIANNLDYEKAKTIQIDERFPLMPRGLYDLKAITKETKIDFPLYRTDAIKFFEDQPKPRFGALHYPWNRLPRQIQNGTKKPKIIHIIRNPKDIAVSFYHFTKIFNNTQAPLEDFCESFLKEIDAYWSNVKSYWEHRHEPNVLIIKYEDMKKDLPSVLQTIAKFFGKKLTQDEIDVLVNHLSFESMKNNKAVNQEAGKELMRKAGVLKGPGTHMRSGNVGQYETTMSNKLIDRFNENINVNGEGLF